MRGDARCWRRGRARFSHGVARRSEGRANNAGKMDLRGPVLEPTCCERLASVMRRTMRHTRACEVCGAHFPLELRSRRCRKSMGFRPCERSPCEPLGEVLLNPTGPRRSLTRIDPPARKPWGIPDLHVLSNVPVRALCMDCAGVRSSARVTRDSICVACVRKNASARAVHVCNCARAQVREWRGAQLATHVRSQMRACSPCIDALLRTHVREWRGAQLAGHVVPQVSVCALCMCAPVPIMCTSGEGLNSC